MRKIFSLITLFSLLCQPLFAFGSGGCDSVTVYENHFDGANGATSSNDENCNGLGGKTSTFVGNAQLSTAKAVFGPTGLLLDGTGDYVTLPDSNDWDFGTGDWAVDFRINENSTVGDSCYMEAGRFSSLAGVQITLTTGILTIFLNGTSVYANAWSPTNGVWYRVLVSRIGTNLRVFIDNVQLGTTVTDSTNITASTNGVFIGANTVGTSAVNGTMDEFRITKGDGRPELFSVVPTSPYCSGCEMVEDD